MIGKIQGRLKKKLPKGSFARNLAALMGGTGFAMILPIAISPILTRLFTPEQFGLFALYVGIISVLSVLSSGRYELAILLPKEDKDSVAIVGLCIVLTFITSIVFLIIITLFNDELATLLNAPEIASWLYFVPFSVFLLGIYQTLSYWTSRQKNYKSLGMSKVAQSTALYSAQLSSGYLGYLNGGLILGHLVGQFVATYILIKNISKITKNNLRRLTLVQINGTLKKYSNFPKYMIGGQLANVLSSQMPLILITSFFGVQAGGFYALSQRVLSAPVGLMANTIGVVFRQEAAERYNRTGNCINLFKKTTKQLIWVALIITLPIVFFGSELYAFVFGDEWLVSGEMASIFAIMVFFQAISGPLSQTVLLAEKQFIDMIWQFSRLISSIVSFAIGFYIFNDCLVAIKIYVTLFSFHYIVHSYIQYVVATGKYNHTIIGEN